MISLDAHEEALASLEARTTATTKADSSAALRNDNKTTGNKERGKGKGKQQIAFGDDNKRSQKAKKR